VISFLDGNVLEFLLTGCSKLPTSWKNSRMNKLTFGLEQSFFVISSYQTVRLGLTLPPPPLVYVVEDFP
jgi:hypothetical protein